MSRRGGSALKSPSSEWVAARGDGFFLPPDAALLPSLGTVSAWVNGQGYEAAAVNTFLQVADYYLTAHAHAHGHTVVTHEVPGICSQASVISACRHTNSIPSRRRR